AQLRSFMLLFLLMAFLPQSARAEGGFFAGFFNFFDEPPVIHLPHPNIHLPKLDITPFWTNDLKQGRDTYAKGEYGRARDAFLRSSEDGNMVADWYLGHMYRLGRGVPVDAAISYSYFLRVSDQFNPDEQDPYRLRIMVDAKIRVADELRLGIPSARLKANPQAAARIYLQMATNYGHPRAFYGLGVMNIEGEGLKENPQQGLKWLNAAIRKHSAEAAAYMGELCAKGDIVPQDDAKALTWYMVAAQAARPDENPEIRARLTQLKFAATEETRIEAEARARVWNEQNPSDGAQ
ncbi:MAG: tetratricopeptide repeat protein, partial [Aestuariivirga sp.]